MGRGGRGGGIEGSTQTSCQIYRHRYLHRGTWTAGHTRVSHSKDEIRNDGNGPTRDSDTVTARARESRPPGPAATLLARLRRNSFNVHVTAEDTEATGKMNTKDHAPGDR